MATYLGSPFAASCNRKHTPSQTGEGLKSPFETDGSGFKGFGNRSSAPQSDSPPCFLRREQQNPRRRFTRPPAGDVPDFIVRLREKFSRENRCLGGV